MDKRIFVIKTGPNVTIDGRHPKEATLHKIDDLITKYIQVSSLGVVKTSQCPLLKSSKLKSPLIHICGHSDGWEEITKKDDIAGHIYHAPENDLSNLQICRNVVERLHLLGDRLGADHGSFILHFLWICNDYNDWKSTDAKDDLLPPDFFGVLERFYSWHNASMSLLVLDENIVEPPTWLKIFRGNFINIPKICEVHGLDPILPPLQLWKGNMSLYDESNSSICFSFTGFTINLRRDKLDFLLQVLDLQYGKGDNPTETPPLDPFNLPNNKLYFSNWIVIMSEVTMSEIPATYITDINLEIVATADSELSVQFLQGAFRQKGKGMMLRLQYSTKPNPKANNLTLSRWREGVMDNTYLQTGVESWLTNDDVSSIDIVIYDAGVFSKNEKGKEQATCCNAGYALKGAVIAQPNRQKIPLTAQMCHAQSSLRTEYLREPAKTQVEQRDLMLQFVSELKTTNELWDAEFLNEDIRNTIAEVLADLMEEKSPLFETADLKLLVMALQDRLLSKFIPATEPLDPTAVPTGNPSDLPPTDPRVNLGIDPWVAIQQFLNENTSKKDGEDNDEPAPTTRAEKIILKCLKNWNSSDKWPEKRFLRLIQLEEDKQKRTMVKSHKKIDKNLTQVGDILRHFNPDGSPAFQEQLEPVKLRTGATTPKPRVSEKEYRDLMAENFVLVGKVIHKSDPISGADQNLPFTDVHEYIGYRFKGEDFCRMEVVQYHDVHYNSDERVEQFDQECRKLRDIQVGLSHETETSLSSKFNFVSIKDFKGSKQSLDRKHVEKSRVGRGGPLSASKENWGAAPPQPPRSPRRKKSFPPPLSSAIRGGDTGASSSRDNSAAGRGLQARRNAGAAGDAPSEQDITELLKRKLRNVVYDALARRKLRERDPIFRQCFKRLFFMTSDFVSSTDSSLQKTTFMREVAESNADSVIKVERIKFENEKKAAKKPRT